MHDSRAGAPRVEAVLEALADEDDDEEAEPADGWRDWSFCLRGIVAGFLAPLAASAGGDDDADDEEEEEEEDEDSDCFSCSRALRSATRA